MPVLTDFCCGCTVKTGTIAAAAFYMIWSLVPIASSAKRLHALQSVKNDIKWAEPVSVTKTLDVVRLTFAVVQAFCGIYLLIGALKEKAAMLPPWLFVEALLVIVLTAVYVVIFTELVEVDETKAYVAIVLVILYVMLSVYFLLVVFSYYQTLRVKPR